MSESSSYPTYCKVRSSPFAMSGYGGGGRGGGRGGLRPDRRGGSQLQPNDSSSPAFRRRATDSEVSARHRIPGRHDGLFSRDASDDKSSLGRCEVRPPPTTRRSAARTRTKQILGPRFRHSRAITGAQSSQPHKHPLVHAVLSFLALANPVSSRNMPSAATELFTHLPHRSLLSATLFSHALTAPSALQHRLSHRDRHFARLSHLTEMQATFDLHQHLYPVHPHLPRRFMLSRDPEMFLNHSATTLTAQMTDDTLPTSDYSQRDHSQARATLLKSSDWNSAPHSTTATRTHDLPGLNLITLHPYRGAPSIHQSINQLAAQPKFSDSIPLAHPQDGGSPTRERTPKGPPDTPNTPSNAIGAQFSEEPAAPFQDNPTFQPPNPWRRTDAVEALRMGAPMPAPPPPSVPIAIPTLS